MLHVMPGHSPGDRRNLSLKAGHGAIAEEDFLSIVTKPQVFQPVCTARWSKKPALLIWASDD
jgi:hypothetical protein